MSPAPIKPLISIVTIAKNSAPFIERCLRSALEQTYPHVEYIVIDGASTDGTQAIIERYRPRLAYYHSRPDSGPYDAQQQGIALAKGDIVGLLHADDWLLPQACEALARMFEETPQAEIFCFGMREYRQRPDGTTVPIREFRDPPGERFGLLDGLYCHGVNRFYRRDTLLRHMPFRTERYPQMADRELYVRMGWEGLRKAWSDKVLYHFLVHPGSNSSGGGASKKAAMLQETAQIAEDWLRNIPHPGLLPKGEGAEKPSPLGSPLRSSSFGGLSVQQPSGALAKGGGLGEGLTPREQSLLQDWQCFNQLRAGWFLLKSGQTPQAMALLKDTFERYPFRAWKNALLYKMPKPYRPT